MKSRIIKIFFAALIAIAAVSAQAATETVNGITWTYTVLSDGTASMYGEKNYYNDFSAIPRSTSGDITVPDIIDGRLVTGIGRYAFYDCKLLRSVSVPDCITSVGESAFANCTSLTSIVLRRVTDIGPKAFSGCYSLRSITLGKDLVRLGGHPSQSFSDCKNVTDVTVPGWQCTIPFDSVTNLVISEGANCISNSAFSGCKKIERVVIPNSVTRIGSEAFEWCTSLKSVVIPSSVTNVGSHAFAYCSAMTNAVILGSGLYHTSSYSSNAPFHDCSNLVSVTTMDTCAYMFKNCNKMQEITLLDGLEKIKDYSFYGCSWLKEIEIPNSVKDIGSSAFTGCRSLLSVVIPNSVTNIGRYAFYDCIGLKCVEFKNSNTRIPYWTTTYSDGSKTYDYPFDGCNSIVDVTIPQHACTMTLAKTFPDSYQSITNIVVLDGVTRIGAECFKNCFGVKRIVIPASVTAIYDNAFKDCSELEEIVFLGDAPDVGSDILLGTPRSLKITVKEGSVGWKGGVSTELPEAWPVGDATARGITYSGINDRPEGGGSSGGESAVVDTRYDLADDVADRAIANVEIDGDAAIDSFVLKDGKVYDSVVRIVNTSASAAKISLPGGFIYEKFKGTKPLEIPATSTNLLTITRTKGNTFLLSREELVLEVQE